MSRSQLILEPLGTAEPNFTEQPKLKGQPLTLTVEPCGNCIFSSSKVFFDNSLLGIIGGSLENTDSSKREYFIAENNITRVVCLDTLRVILLKNSKTQPTLNAIPPPHS